jgi:hypothetical protein
MALVAVNTTTAGSGAIDVTLDTGTSSNRKAICLYFHQQTSSAVTGTAVRDPAGSNESCTLERSISLLDTGQAFYVLDAFRLDLSVTGSQTFRFNTASGGLLRSGATVLVWDELASGAAEVIESYTTTSSVSVLSDVIASLTDNALLVSGGFLTFTAGTPQTAPFWTQDNGQDERADAVASSVLPFSVGSLVKAVAGSQTLGATGNATGRTGGQVLLSYAPFVVLGPTITVQPANDVGIISNGQSTVYTTTATGTTISNLVWREDGSTIGHGGIYNIVTTGIGTGSASSTLTITRTSKTNTPWDIRASVTDANGTTETNTVTDTWWTGPVLTTFPATDGDGESTATLTCDYVTGVGEAIEVRIPLSDGDVAVTVTTT